MSNGEESVKGVLLVAEKETTEERQRDELKKNEDGQAWVGLFVQNKMTAQGMNLSYPPPIVQEGKVLIRFEREDMDEGNEKWKKVLVLYVLGNTASIGAIERFVASKWNFVMK